MKEYNRNKFSAQAQNETKTRAKKLTEELALRSDGSTQRVLVIDRTEKALVDFIAFHRGGVDMHYTPYESSILLTFLRLMRHDNVVIGSVESLIKETGIGKNSLIKALKTLRARFVISKISQGVYMVNPKIATMVSAQYLPILEKAWANQNVSHIERDMRALDKEKRDVTRENARKCREAGLVNNVTVPELDDAKDENEEYWILHQKSLEEVLQGCIERGEVI